MKKSTKKHLETIAARLSGGHASLFVGAGFSKNAIPISGNHLPPDWNELGDMFFEKARGKRPLPEDKKYASVLRLAEEVECVCGRGALTNLITKAIDNDNLAPSDLHMQLLALPWKDVFTTNYDTLLDRTASKLIEQGGRVYSIIKNVQEIGISTPPFLMKLHGDIKNPDSIIITEEDYRRYPAQHQAMIAHIQHTIMLETLVLIGFSGNDPNFIQWLGWVKDALNTKQRKVYLLTVGEVSRSMIKTFKKKNVIIVDLCDFTGKGASASACISAAIQYMADYQRRQEEEILQYQKKAWEWGRTTSLGEDINITYKKWREERNTYPGWLIMPREKREYIAGLEGFTLLADQIKKLQEADDIFFLDLFNWRIEKCLFPIDNSWESTYISVLAKYKPFESEYNENVRIAWINLKLGLLRLYRQEGWNEKWEGIDEELLSLKERIPLEQRCRLAYEEALMAVYQCDFTRLERVLENWPEQTEDPYWDVRRGALWAEYLSFEKGLKITKTACEIIKRQFEGADRSDLFYWGSRMVHAQTVWNSMANANFSMNKDATNEARFTWNKLRLYDDIWYEREFFEANLRPIEKVLSVQAREASFTLGHSRTSTNMSGNSKDYRIAYAYFLYYEESGFPIHLPNLNAIHKPTLEKALSIMEYSSPAIAESWLLRSGDPKLVSAVFNRRYLNRVSFQTVSNTYEHYQACLEMLVDNEQCNTGSSWVLVFRHILPEILSILCMKATFDARRKTLDTVDSIFASGNSIQYEGLDVLLSSLIRSFSDAQNLSLIPRYARMNTAANRFNDFRLEPFVYLKDPEDYKVPHDSELIHSLFESFGKSDYADRALVFRLIFLKRCSEFNKAEEEILAELLWRKTDDSGFPAGVPYAKFGYLNIPHPTDVRPHDLLRRYFSLNTLPRMGKTGAISVYGGRIPLLNEIKGTLNKNVHFEWDSELLNQLCADIAGVWESDKERLKAEEKIWGLSIKEELLGRLQDIEIVLAGVVASNLRCVNQTNRKALAKMITELEKFNCPSLRVRVALKDLIEASMDLDDEIKKRMGSSERKVVDDCLKTIYYLDAKGEDVSEWVELMSEYFRSNSIPGRSYIISGLAYFIKKEAYAYSMDIQRNLLIGLGRLFGDTAISATDSELTANEKMHLRMMAAPIVRELVDLGVDYSILVQCKAYYESEDTCWDVRNRYCDVNE